MRRLAAFFKVELKAGRFSGLNGCFIKRGGNDLLNFLRSGGTEGLLGESFRLIDRYLPDGVTYACNLKGIHTKGPDAHSYQQAADRWITGRFPADRYGYPLVDGGLDYLLRCP